MAALLPVAAKQAWLLQETAALPPLKPPPSVALVAATGGCVLMLYEGVAVGWGLLTEGQAELMDAYQLYLHCHHTCCSLVLDGFLCGGICGAKICKRFTLQHKQCVVAHSSHTVAMICGRDGRLVYERNLVGPIFLEGLN